MKIPFLSRYLRRRRYEQALEQVNKAFFQELDVVLKDIELQLLVKELERGKANGSFVPIRQADVS